MLKSNKEVIIKSLKGRTIQDVEYSNSHGRLIVLKLDNGETVSFMNDEFESKGIKWEELAVFINGEKF